MTNSKAVSSNVQRLSVKRSPTAGHYLGGGHEVAWASFQGLAGYLQNHQPQSKPKIGIINFDAHFDLRAFHSQQAEVKPSSGTPFNQIQHFCQQSGWDFHYACLGVSRASNTKALFERADQLNVWYVEDKDLGVLNLDYHLTELQHFIDGCDYLYLTIDLDVFRQQPHQASVRQPPEA